MLGIHFQGLGFRVTCLRFGVLGFTVTCFTENQPALSLIPVMTRARRESKHNLLARHPKLLGVGYSLGTAPSQ